MRLEHPKTERLRKLRPVFFQIGLLVSLGVTLGAFKWTTHGDNADLSYRVEKDIPDVSYGEINIIDEQKKEVVTKKEVKLVPPDPDKINLVDNETKLDTNTKEVEEYTNPDLEGLMAAKPSGFDGKEIFKDDLNTDPETWVEKMPTFPGGYEARARFIQKHMTVPYDVLMNADQNITVWVEAVVEKDGRLTAVKAVKDGGFPSAGEAAVAVVQRMPKWNAGYQGIWPVRVRVSIPIKIKIQTQR